MKKLLFLIISLLTFSCQTIDEGLITQLGTDGTEYVFFEEDIISNDSEINEHYMTFKAHYLNSIDLSNAKSHLDLIELKYAYFKSYLENIGYDIHNLNITQPEKFKKNAYDRIFKSNKEIKRLKGYTIFFILILIWGIILLYSYVRKNANFRSMLSIIIIIILFSIISIYNIILIQNYENLINTVERDTYRELFEYKNTT
jgi:amino acid permease